MKDFASYDEIERGHYGVKVKVEELFRECAKVIYLTTGWKDEPIGTIETVEFYRLKPFTEFLFFIPNSKAKKGFEDLGNEGRISNVLVAQFDHA